MVKKREKSKNFKIIFKRLEANGDKEELFLQSELSVDEASENSALNCLQCDECGKKFSSVELAQLHSTRSGHCDFSESCSSDSRSGELTAEQKANKLKELKIKLAEKKAKDQERLAKESISMELNRRKEGKEMEKIKRDLEIKEIEKITAERKKEKEENKKYLIALRAKIEQDRIDKKMKDLEEKNRKEGDSSLIQESSVINPLKGSSNSSSSCRIQVKLPDGSALKFSFDNPSIMTFGELKQKIFNEVPSNISSSLHKLKLMSTFPTIVYDSKDDKKSLVDLNLTPSASLMFK